LILIGKTNEEIAAELFISINTVKKHLSHIFNKTEVHNRTELAAVVYK
jgi:DNA-binding CsgD family transcriptional regulator